MEVLDAYYNGTFTVTVTPPSSNATYQTCPELKSQVVPDAFFRVGPESKGNTSRKSYGDENSYYFHFGRSIHDQNCPQTPSKAFINFESSNDELQHAQAWKLNQKKSGDHFELDGTFNSNFAHYNNYWNYVVNATGYDKPSNGSAYPYTCPRRFSMKTLTAGAGAKMTATVSATEAKMQFSFTEAEYGYTVTGSFTGQHWTKGPKLLFQKDAIDTEGEVPHVKPRKPKTGAFWDQYGKYIIIAGVIVVLGVIIYVLWQCCAGVFACCGACFRCCGCSKDRAEKRRAAKEQKKWAKERDLEQQNAASFMGKQPEPVVYPVAEPQIENTTGNVSYQVSPTVAESYGVMGGVGSAEIKTAQEELHKAHVGLQAGRARNDIHLIMHWEAMVGHWSGVIEHWMAVRKGQM
jgi:hypothetical protein